jgi:hypothetical protein
MKELISINLVITKLSMLLLGGPYPRPEADGGRAPTRMETRREGKLARRLLLRSLLSRQLGVTVSAPSAALLLGCWSWRGGRSGRVSRSHQGRGRSSAYLLVLVVFVHLLNTYNSAQLRTNFRFSK